VEEKDREKMGGGVDSGGSKNSEKRERKTIYQSRRYLSQMHTTDCMPFTLGANIRAAAPTTLPLNPPLDVERGREEEVVRGRKGEERG